MNAIGKKGVHIGIRIGNGKFYNSDTKGNTRALTGNHHTQEHRCLHLTYRNPRYSMFASLEWDVIGPA